MKFSKTKSIDVTLEEEEIEVLRKTQIFIDKLTEKMEDTSLYIAKCIDFDIDFDELNQMKLYIEKLQEITNIYRGNN